jgi:hypothetical protein
MIPELVKAILSAYAVVGLVTIIAGGCIDHIGIGNAESYNDWLAKNYKIIGDKYYRIHPPNCFESNKERRKRYKTYCDNKNRRNNGKKIV